MNRAAVMKAQGGNSGRRTGNNVLAAAHFAEKFTENIRFSRASIARQKDVLAHEHCFERGFLALGEAVVAESGKKAFKADIG